MKDDLPGNVGVTSWSSFQTFPKCWWDPFQQCALLSKFSTQHFSQSAADHRQANQGEALVIRAGDSQTKR